MLLNDSLRNAVNSVHKIVKSYIWQITSITEDDGVSPSVYRIIYSSIYRPTTVINTSVSVAVDHFIREYAA